MQESRKLKASGRTRNCSGVVFSFELPCFFIAPRDRLIKLSAVSNDNTLNFLESTGWGNAAREPLTGDASARKYLRLRRGGRTAILMDASRLPEILAPFVFQGLEFAHCSARWGLKCWCFSSANPLR